MAKIDAFFKLMHENSASDLHLVAGQPPALRINGDIERVKYKVLDTDELRSMLYEITAEDKVKVFEETGDVDFAYEIPGLARYRANYFMQKNGIGAVFREIPSTIATAAELGLPSVISKLASLPRGLVLVTGPTGSGKSTTLAAIIDVANTERSDHIITIEDPIEFVHQCRGCIVNHREVGLHTKTFSAALRGALREDPDIILVGEMREPGNHLPGDRSRLHRPPGICDPAYHQCSQDRRPNHRSLSGRGTSPDPLNFGRWNPGYHIPDLV
jgi:twitching motility protein PilT